MPNMAPCLHVVPGAGVGVRAGCRTRVLACMLFPERELEFVLVVVHEPLLACYLRSGIRSSCWMSSTSLFLRVVPGASNSSAEPQMQNPRSEPQMQNPKCKTINAEPPILNPRSEPKDAEAQMQNYKCRTQCAEAELRMQDSKSNTSGGEKGSCCQARRAGSSILPLRRGARD